MLDCTNNEKKLVKRAFDIGLSGIAITDHDGCQAFPHIFNEVTSYNKKLLSPFKDKIKNLEDDYTINAKFELVIDGGNNSTVTYNLGTELIGRKPYITVGYMDESGINDYYTYDQRLLSKHNQPKYYVECLGVLP